MGGEKVEEDGGEFGVEGDGAFPVGLGFVDAAEGGESAAEIEEGVGGVGGGLEGEAIEIGGALEEVFLVIEDGEGGAEFAAEEGVFGGAGEREGSIKGGLGGAGFGVGGVEEAEGEPGGRSVGVVAECVLPG